MNHIDILFDPTVLRPGITGDEHPWYPGYTCPMFSYVSAFKPRIRPHVPLHLLPDNTYLNDVLIYCTTRTGIETR